MTANKRRRLYRRQRVIQARRAHNLRRRIARDARRRAWHLWVQAKKAQLRQKKHSPFYRAPLSNWVKTMLGLDRPDKRTK